MRETQSDTADKKLTTVNEPRRNFGIDDFVKIYGISRTTVYQEIRAGRLRPFKCGKRTLISRESAEAWQTLQEKGA